MKRFYTFLLASMGLGLAANAQRVADLEVTLVTPANNSVFTSGDALNPTFTIKNLGEDTVRTTDTLLVSIILDGELFTVTNSNGQTIPLQISGPLSSPLFPDSSVTLRFSEQNLGINFPAQMNGPHQLCVAVFPLAGGGRADTLADNIPANNFGCADQTWTGGADQSSVTSFDKDTHHGGFLTQIAPNPAKNVANFSLNMTASSEVSVHIVDISGRIVRTQNAGVLHAGNHTIAVPTTGLTTGLYAYRISFGTKGNISGKLSVIE